MKPVWKDSDTEFAVSFTITNTGKRYGQEIAQLYLHQNKCSVERPFKELKGFTKVGLKPGESKQVTIKLPRRLTILRYRKQTLERRTGYVYCINRRIVTGHQITERFRTEKIKTHGKQ